MNAENLTIENLRRVSVVGTSGSGKTTFAKHLARILQVRHTELDAINWLPDWVERPHEEFLTLVEKETETDTWVFDGNYTRTRETIWRRATAIIWLDYSFSRTFYRSLSRTTRRVFTGERVYSGNRETFRQAFLSRDSIILGMLTSYHRKRRRFDRILRDDRMSDKEIFIFRHPKQAEEFLWQVERLNH